MKATTGSFAAALSVGAVSVVILASCGSPSADPSPSAPSATSDSRLQPFYQQSPSWRSCSGGNLCTEIEVPLNYADPSAKSIKVAVLKVPASDPSKRLGTLVVNPGGPGASGIDYAQQVPFSWSPAVTAAYDIVGFDPRGVGKSTPIDCMDDKQTQRFIATAGAPSDAAQLAAVVDVTSTVGATCERNSAYLTPFVGTVAVARDMDILRGALGETKLNFLMKSYGTFIGLTYVDLFADHVGRTVVDGVIDPTLTNDQLAGGQSKGFQLALSRFIADCPKHRDCPLPAGQEKGLATIQAFLAKISTKPLKAVPGRPLTRPMAGQAFVATMYDNTDGWPALRVALGSALAGDGSMMLEIVDSFTGRQPNGSYPENSIDALYAVNCLDRPDRADVAQTGALAAEWAKTAPTFGPDLAWGNLPCHDWPAPATDTPHVVTGAGAPPIVVVGTINDPATPYPWAVTTSKQLIGRSLVTWNGDGHTAYGRGSKCIDGLVDAFLVGGTLPPNPSTC
ncbi:MAG: alpha/beta hydrolase [Actinomycetes bacterium]